MVAIISGEPLGERMLIPGKVYFVGRAQQCDLHIQNEYVSRDHARIFNQGETWYIENHSRSNGVVLVESGGTRIIRMKDEVKERYGFLEDTVAELLDEPNKHPLASGTRIYLAALIEREPVLGIAKSTVPELTFLER